MTQPLNDPTSPTASDLREEIRDERLARAADILDALSLFWRGRRPKIWYAAWNDVWAGVTPDGSPAETTPAPGLDALEVERAFAKCFYGVGEATIPLAQSCWETPEGTYGGRAALACTELYQRFGLKTDGEDHLPDDHAAVMLAFAANLLRWGEWETLARFLSRGLNTWWPKLIAALLKTPEGAVLLPVAVATERAVLQTLARAEAECAGCAENASEAAGTEKEPSETVPTA